MGCGKSICPFFSLPRELTLAPPSSPFFHQGQVEGFHGSNIPVKMMRALVPRRRVA